MRRIRFARLARGITQFEVARATGIGQGRLSLIERGYILPNDTEREKLAAFLRTPGDSLLEIMTIPDTYSETAEVHIT